MNQTAVLLDYMSVLLEAGSPLLPAVQTVESIRKDARWKKFVHFVRGELVEGNPFSVAVAKADPSFLRRYGMQLRIAENTGHLPEACRRIARQHAVAEARKAEWQKMLAYPVFVLFAAVGCAWMLGQMVLPTFRELYVGMDVPLPRWFSTLEVTLRYGPPGVIFLLSLCVIVVQRMPHRLRGRIEILLFRFPVLGKPLRRRAFAEFLHALSILTLSHVSLQKALRLVGSESMPALKPVIRKIEQGVASGRPFSEMVREMDLASEWVLALLKLGEESGQLDRMLLRIAQRMDAEERTFFQTLFSLAEPVLVALTGVGVGLFIYLVVGPLFDLLTRMTW